MVQDIVVRNIFCELLGLFSTYFYGHCVTDNREKKGTRYTGEVKQQISRRMTDLF